MLFLHFSSASALKLRHNPRLDELNKPSMDITMPSMTKKRRSSCSSAGATPWTCHCMAEITAEISLIFSSAYDHIIFLRLLLLLLGSNLNHT